MGVRVGDRIARRAPSAVQGRSIRGEPDLVMELLRPTTPARCMLLTAWYLSNNNGRRPEKPEYFRVFSGFSLKSESFNPVRSAEARGLAIARRRTSRNTSGGSSSPGGVLNAV